MKRKGPILTTTSLAAIALLYLPMLAVAWFSFNQAKTGVVWGGFTLRWYQQLFHDRDILHATFNSLVLAVVSSVIATVLGTALAIGIDRFPWGRRMRRMLDTVLYLPVVMPDIIIAVALLVVFMGIQAVVDQVKGDQAPQILGLGTMTVGHVTFQVSFVALVVRARIATLDKSLEEAARDLYANSAQVFWRVIFPLLLPAIVGGFLLAFTLSIDDFVISFFTKGGPESSTLPIYVYSSVKRGVSPELHALSMVIFVATILLVLLVQWGVKDPRTAKPSRG